MGVAGKIGKDLDRTAEGRLEIDHPIRLSQGSDLLGEGGWFGEQRKSAEEAQLAIKERRFERGEEQTPEKTRESMNG